MPTVPIDSELPRNVWHTLSFRRVESPPKTATVAWNPSTDYCFPSGPGHVVQGGLVATILDAAMAGACWAVLEDSQSFLTADLRVEYLRVTRPGELRAVGTVVRRTRRVIFCAAELRNANGEITAVSRCTQVVMPSDGTTARGWAGETVPLEPADPT
jgi:uncharacterized protein (TIGR00369 family)